MSTVRIPPAELPIELSSRASDNASSTQAQRLDRPIEQSTPLSDVAPSMSPPSSPLPPEPLSYAMLFRLITVGYSFFCAGVNDGSLGPLIPYLLDSYHINTSFVSIVYIVTFFGWFLTALTNSHLTRLLDTGAILVMGAVLQTIAHVLRVIRPPFGLFAAAFFFAPLGQAYQDTHANTYVSGVKNAPHRWLGFIHAMYACGLLVGPFVSTAVAAADKPSRWHLFYAFPLALCTVNVLCTIVAFRDTVKMKRSSIEHVSEEEAEGQEVREAVSMSQRNKNAFKEMLDIVRMPSVWLLSLFFFFFLGVFITVGGWVVTYLVDIRRGAVKDMGYVAAGYAGGMFFGRLLLAEPTYRFGERRMILLYVLLCLALELCFWFIIAGAVTVSLLGFFSGPFFATGVSVGTKLFPEHVKSSALSFVFVLGQMGGAMFPALTGLIATRVGVGVLQPVLVGLLAATAVSWMLIPKPKTD